MPCSHIAPRWQSITSSFQRSSPVSLSKLAKISSAINITHIFDHWAQVLKVGAPSFCHSAQLPFQSHIIPGVLVFGSEGARSVPQGCLPVCLTSETAASSDPPALREDLTGLIYNVRPFKTISPSCWQQSCIYKLAETLTFRLIITCSERGKLTSIC